MVLEEACWHSRKSGISEIRKCGIPEPEIRKSGIPKTRYSGHPEIRNSENPEFRKSGILEVRVSGISEFRNSRNPDFRKSGIPENRKSGFPGFSNIYKVIKNNSQSSGSVSVIRKLIVNRFYLSVMFLTVMVLGWHHSLECLSTLPCAPLELSKLHQETIQEIVTLRKSEQVLWVSSQKDLTCPNDPLDAKAHD